ncbi:bacterial Ig-like domain-containing protein [Lapidilactobacillus achengensis]|uniref:Bacterial Ig-like domain-containing protein n=1 Tax=Lapidilactobacillus achengensis TaxID=2486000 RepID=A0ABW1UKX2_9LACO|nr:bacterial Ig-like domain-containing protein [Lapidilactobacillus achengensis]
MKKNRKQFSAVLVTTAILLGAVCSPAIAAGAATGELEATLTDRQPVAASATEQELEQNNVSVSVGQGDESANNEVLASDQSAQTTEETATTPAVPAPAEPTPAPGTETIDQWMPDKNFQKIVLASLVKKKLLIEPVTVNDITKELVGQMKEISADTTKQFEEESFYLAAKNITSIEGVQFATNLQRIAIYPEGNASVKWDKINTTYSKISDISQLAQLKNIKDFAINQSYLSDISFFKNFPLRKIDLSYNSIADISALNNQKFITASLSKQHIVLPKVHLNPSVIEYTTPSFVIRNLQSQNVPLTPVKKGDDGLGYLTTATGVAGSNNQVTWTDLEDKGALISTWDDPFQGDPTRSFRGMVVTPYELDVNVGNVDVGFQTEAGLVLKPNQTLSGTLETTYDLKNVASVQDVLTGLLNNGWRVKAINGSERGTYQAEMAKVVYVLTDQPEPVDQSDLEVKDSSLTVGDTWQAIGNVVKVVDAAGNELDLTGKDINAIPGLTYTISQDGVTVDALTTVKPGDYQVTYQYQGTSKTTTKTAKVTVKAAKPNPNPDPKPDPDPDPKPDPDPDPTPDPDPDPDPTPDPDPAPNPDPAPQPKPEPEKPVLPKPILPVTGGGDKTVKPTATKPVLPQTGEQSAQRAQILGLILLGFSTLAGILYFSKRWEDLQ